MNIGVFDSGIGGLTVLEEVVRLLPGYDYIFYGDSANNPYGEKSDEQLMEIYAPIGLDIGGESLNEIAISVVAEMMAVKNNRDGGFSRDKKRHDMFPDAV